MLIITIGLPFTVFAQAPAPAQPREKYFVIENGERNRILFSVTDGFLLAGGLVTSSAKKDRGKSSVGLALILFGAVVGAANQVTNTFTYGKVNWDISEVLNRDCKVIQAHPDLNASMGLVSLSEALSIFDQEPNKIIATCSLIARIREASQDHERTFSDALARDTAGTSDLTASDLRIIRNLYAVNGVI